MEKKEDKLAKARKIAKAKVEFIRHLGIYALVMVVLAVINNITSPGGYQWWIWPAIGWGIGVFINFLVVFVFKGSNLKKLEEQLAQKELEKMKDE